MKAVNQRDAFKQRVRYWAEKLDANVTWLGIRPMRNKWASYSTAGHLNFNDELLDLDQELLHFFVPNHGKLWKSLMRAHLGEYEAHEMELKRIALEWDSPTAPE
jgi:predicted metal-dependent hydrolase